MPAASSKPAPQTTPLEGQDTAKYLFGVVEKKIRNLEKRKVNYFVEFAYYSEFVLIFGS